MNFFKELWAPQPGPRTQEEMQSQVLDFLRFPMTFWVLLVHVNPHLSPFFTPIQGIDFSNFTFTNFYSIVARLTNVGGHVVLCFFFLTSGYYFFYKTKIWNLSVYKDKIKKRWHTLIIPYLLWNAIWYVSNLTRELFKYFKKGMPDDRWEGIMSNYLNPESFLDTFWTASEWAIGRVNIFGWDTSLSGPAILPLWYMRELIIMVLLSPIIYWVIKKGKTWAMALLGVCYALNAWTTPGLNVTAVFTFTFGAYLALNGKDILITFAPLKWPATLVALSNLFINIFLPEDYEAYKQITMNVYCISAAIAFITWTTVWFKSKHRPAIRPNLWKTGFFAYASHALNFGILNIWFLANAMTIADFITGAKYSAYGAFASMLIAPLLGMAICVTVYYLMKRFAPNALRLLVGGRI